MLASLLLLLLTCEPKPVERSKDKEKPEAGEPKGEEDDMEKIKVVTEDNLLHQKHPVLGTFKMEKLGMAIGKEQQWPSSYYRGRSSSLILAQCPLLL